MHTHVATLSAAETIESALATFEDLRIGGAPVVDDSERVIGVLTLSDVTRTEHLKQGRIDTSRGDFDMSEVTGEEDTDETDPNEVFLAKEDYSAGVTGSELVGNWMTREVITVHPDDRLDKVCATMVKQRIHRVFVTENDRLVGVISSFDIVRCVAGTAKALRGKRG
jgi:CBS domain-containing protein